MALALVLAVAHAAGHHCRYRPTLEMACLKSPVDVGAPSMTDHCCAVRSFQQTIPTSAGKRCRKVDAIRRIVGRLALPGVRDDHLKSVEKEGLGRGIAVDADNHASAVKCTVVRLKI